MRTTNRSRWISGLLAVVAGGAITMASAPASAGSDDGREARRAWMKGKRALGAGRFAEAEASLCEAMEIAPVPQHVIDCARALVAQEKWGEAREILAPWAEGDLDLTALEARAVSGLWKKVEAHDDRETSEDVPPEDRPRRGEVRDDEPRDDERGDEGTAWPGIVTLAAGGAALGVGATFGVIAAVTASDVRGRCQDDVCPPHLADDAQASATYGDVSTASFIVGGALAVGGVALLVALSGDDDEDRRGGAAPTGRAALFVSPRGAGLRGSF